MIVIHVAAVGFSDLSSSSWKAVDAYDSVARIAVPLFFMVTGALLVPKSHGVPSILRRVQRVSIPLVAWSMIYIVYFRIAAVSDSPSVLQIFSGPVVYHFWFLYTLLGAYLFMPVMAGFYQGNKIRTVLFVLLMFFVGASLVPTVVGLTGIRILGIDWSFLSWPAGYLVLGSVLFNYVDFKGFKIWALAAVMMVSMLAIAIGTWAMSYGTGASNQIFFVYYSPFVMLASVAAFVLLMKLHRTYLDGNTVLGKGLSWFGEVSFGIFLVHPLVIYLFKSAGISFDFINPWLGIPALVVMVLALSALTVFVLQRVPFVKRIVPS